MDSLHSLDVALFRFVNLDLKNWFFDWLLPFFDSNAAFVPALVLLSVWLILKGGARGRLFVCFLLLTFVIGDPLIVSSLKKFIDRPRPFTTLTDISLLVEKMENASMPSGHAANWFAAALVAFRFYRRSLWFMLPLAAIEAFSRIYLGVHYPSDVIVGSMIGVGYAVVILWGSEAIWRLAGPRWFPLWHAELPSLVSPSGRTVDLIGHASAASPSVAAVRPVREDSSTSLLDQHWARLAYVLIGMTFLGNVAYLATGRIELSEDEAYQWLWSKNLDLSYYSKPPLIAYIQFLGTTLWGDNAFGVRFFSAVLGAITGLLMARFVAREVNGFAACLSVLVTAATPLLMVGATLMTIDSLSVLFWMAAAVWGWAAVQRNSTGAWLWTGLWMGLGFLSKYVALFQWLCWLAFFVLWRPARAQLRRPGPYLALLINLICLAPVLIWNARNDWVTLTHLAERGGLDHGWQPTLRFVIDFLAAEAVLLNPVFFIGMIWAAVAFWRGQLRNGCSAYLFSMGAPLFVFYLCYALGARVQPNWIAPAVLPLFCLMLIYWDDMWRRGSKAVKHGFMAGMTIGLIAVASLHDTRVIGKLFGTPLSVELDPLRRVLGWKEMAKVVGEARTDLSKEGQPVFVIAGHYGTTSLLSFYLPEAKKGVPDSPLVYFLSSRQPKNQFYFWPGYQMRKGQNAIYVSVINKGERLPPSSLQREFASVTPLGTRDILFRGRVFHRIQLFACRNLR